MRTVKERYVDDKVRCTAATILSGFICSMESPASLDSAQVHMSDVNPVSTPLQLIGGK